MRWVSVLLVEVVVDGIIADGRRSGDTDVGAGLVFYGGDGSLRSVCCCQLCCSCNP